MLNYNKRFTKKVIVDGNSSFPAKDGVTLLLDANCPDDFWQKQYL